MEDLLEDFLKGDEVKAVRSFFASHTVTELAVLVAVSLGALVCFPRLTLAAVVLSVGSLFVAHCIKKWSK